MEYPEDDAFWGGICTRTSWRVNKNAQYRPVDPENLLTLWASVG